MIENYINQVINGDCVKVMSEMPEGSIDLIVTSPPYGVNIAYDTHDDDMFFGNIRHSQDNGWKKPLEY